MKKVYRVLIESDKVENKTVVISVKETEEAAENFTEIFMDILRDGFKLYVEEIEFDENKTNK